MFQESPCESYPMWGYRNFIRIFAGNPNHIGALPMSAGPIPWWLGPTITLPKTNIAPEKILKKDPWKKKKILLEASIFRDYVSFRECRAPADGWRLIVPNTQCTEYLLTSQFFVPFSGWFSDDCKFVSDLQLGDKKVTLKHLVNFHGTCR